MTDSQSIRYTIRCLETIFGKLPAAMGEDDLPEGTPQAFKPIIFRHEMFEKKYKESSDGNEKVIETTSPAALLIKNPNLKLKVIANYPVMIAGDFSKLEIYAYEPTLLVATKCDNVSIDAYSMFFAHGICKYVDAKLRDTSIIDIATDNIEIISAPDLEATLIPTRLMKLRNKKKGTVSNYDKPVVSTPKQTKKGAITVNMEIPGIIEFGYDLNLNGKSEMKNTPKYFRVQLEILLSTFDEK